MAYSEDLRRLRAQVERKRQLETIVQELQTQRAGLTSWVQELERKMQLEQADVDRLEGHSLAAFFYGVIGKMDEKLTKERREAYAARVKYDAAARELADLEAELREREAELRTLSGCEARYAQALHERGEALKAAGGAVGAEILKLEARLAELESQRRELREAVSAGEAARNTADAILSSLGSAEGWATWDLVGGGLLSDLAKHSHLDEAQRMVEQLQAQLRRFKTELADVTIQADLQISIDGFLRFADYFFDGLFADWMVLDSIGQSQSQAQETRNQIQLVLDRLAALQRATDREQQETKACLDRVIHEASEERPGLPE